MHTLGKLSIKTMTNVSSELYVVVAEDAENESPICVPCRPNQADNAKRIVLTWNKHQELINACRMALEWQEKYLRDYAECYVYSDSETSELLQNDDLCLSLRLALNTTL